jgi:hypothetical protein
MGTIQGVTVQRICAITGLSRHELDLLAAGTNRIIVIPDAEQFTAPLDQLGMAVTYNFAVEIDAMAESSHRDHVAFGRDLGGVADDSAETPYSYHDIAEKVRAMPPGAVLILLGYVSGVCDGIGTAQA